MKCSTRLIVHACSVLLAGSALAACDKGKDASPEVIEVPVPLLSAQAPSATPALSEPKRYAEEKENKGEASVNEADVPIRFEASDEAPVVQRLALGTKVTRLVDVGAFSLVEYPDGSGSKQGWIRAASLENSAEATKEASAEAAPTATAAAATTPTAATTASSATPSATATATATASATPVSSATPAATVSDTPAATTTATAKPRRGRLGR